jgi:hypothetical protein
MKTLRINLCLLLILATQIYAQRFTAGTIDSIHTGFADNSENYGYFPDNKQIALLGEKSSSYANVMLVGGPYIQKTNLYEKIHSYNVVNSHGNVFNTIYPKNATSIIKNSAGENFFDNNIGAVLVLDSLNDGKKNAIVLFSSLAKLFVVQIAINDANKMSYSIIEKIDLPESMWIVGVGTDQGRDRRLALLGTSQNGSNKIYHIAIGNPNSNAKGGRVDFFSLIEKTWTFSQSNTQGLASGINGLFFGTEIGRAHV